MDEVEDAVTTGIEAGDEARPGDRTLRRSGRAERRNPPVATSQGKFGSGPDRARTPSGGSGSRPSIPSTMTRLRRVAARPATADGRQQPPQIRRDAEHRAAVPRLTRRRLWRSRPHVLHRSRCPPCVRIGNAEEVESRRRDVDEAGSLTSILGCTTTRPAPTRIDAVIAAPRLGVVLEDRAARRPSRSPTTCDIRRCSRRETRARSRGTGRVQLAVSNACVIPASRLRRRPAGEPAVISAAGGRSRPGLDDALAFAPLVEEHTGQTEREGARSRPVDLRSHSPDRLRA